LDAGLELSEVFYDGQRPGTADLARRAGAAGSRTLEVPTRVLEAIATTDTPQGIVAVAPMRPVELEALPPDLDLALVLCGIQDPGNAGTLVRSAAAAGAGAVVFTAGAVDPYSAKTARGAAGSLFRLPIVRGAEPVTALSALRDRGIQVVALDAGADLAYDAADLRGPVALVVGNEAAGLDTDIQIAVDITISIPMPGGVESLNAGVAGSLALFEVVRQRRASRAPG
jgi:TrmH family RNA methyltransferase